ncbi:tetraspanin-7-like [Bacillus rossius redtenbacheri]|uniref:tetraspanin-7-like n=1 Tax=Bacillus rossius redtenbacheri TaxID=93214 RepID=UPI002FDEB82B
MGQRLQTVAAMACMKSLLMLFNFVFWMTGVVVLGIGIWMQVELYKYMELSADFSSTAPYVLLGTGALIVLVGSLACCCTVKGQPALLYSYGAFLFLVFVLELSAGVSTYAYRGKLQAGFDRGLNQTIAAYDPATAKGMDFNFMQKTLHCCGNHAYTDWRSSPLGKVPPSCCQNDTSCDTSNPQEIYSRGCYDVVVDFLNGNIGLVAGSALGFAFFPLLGLALSCCLAKNINKAKYEQMA